MQTTIDTHGATWIGRELQANNLDYTVGTEPLTFGLDHAAQKAIDVLDLEYGAGDNKQILFDRILAAQGTLANALASSKTGEDFWSFRVWPDGSREPIKPVGKNFRPLQNYEAFDFLNHLVPEGMLEVEQYADYRQGKAMLIRAKILSDMPLRVADDYLDEAIWFINGHDGHTVAGAMYGPRRPACMNQLVFIYRKQDRAPAHTFKIRHTKNAGSRLASALLAMQKARPYYQHVASHGEYLASRRIKTRDAERMFRKLIPDAEKSGRGQTMAEKKRGEIVAVWRESENLEDIRFTEWGWLNSIIEWNDHNRAYANDDVRFDAIFRGRNLYRSALDILDARK